MSRSWPRKSRCSSGLSTVRLLLHEDRHGRNHRCVVIQRAPHDVRTSIKHPFLEVIGIIHLQSKVAIFDRVARPRGGNPQGGRIPGFARRAIGTRLLHVNPRHFERGGGHLGKAGLRPQGQSRHGRHDDGSGHGDAQTPRCGTDPRTAIVRSRLNVRQLPAKLLQLRAHSSARFWRHRVWQCLADEVVDMRGFWGVHSQLLVVLFGSKWASIPRKRSRPRATCLRTVASVHSIAAAIWP